MRRTDEAKASLDEAIWTAEATRYDEVVTEASIKQIYVTGNVDEDMPGARRWFRQAEAFLARMEGHELLRAWTEQNFGAALDVHGDLEEAATRYRTALQIKERVLGPNHPDVGFSLTNLAGVLSALGRSEEALKLSSRGVRLMEQVLGGEHPDTAVQLANRAAIFNHLGRYADARADALRALAVWEKELGPDHGDLPFFLGPLGEAYLGLEQPREALGPLARALIIAERNNMRGELRRLRFTLAQALWRSGTDRKRAIEVGLTAALPLPVDADEREGRVAAQRGAELQQRAAEWVAARQSEMRTRYPGGHGLAAGSPFPDVEPVGPSRP